MLSEQSGGCPRVQLVRLRSHLWKWGSGLKVLHKFHAASSYLQIGLCPYPSRVVLLRSEAPLSIIIAPTYLCFCLGSGEDGGSFSARTKQFTRDWMFQPVILQEEKMTCSWKKIRADLKAYVKKYNHISSNCNSFRGCLQVLKCLL